MPGRTRWLLCAAVLLAAERVAAQGASPQFYVPFDNEQPAATIAGGSAQPHVSGVPQFAPGRRGGALVVRNGNVLAFPSAGNIRWEAGTLAFWVSLIPPPGGGEFSDQVIFTANSPSTPGYMGLQLLSPTRPENGNLLEFWLVRFPGVGEVRLRVGGIKERWPFGTWHHVALTWNRERWTLFLDGEPVAEAVAGRGLEPGEAPASLNLGDASAPVPNASGLLLDDLMLFHYPLTLDEVRVVAGTRAAPAAPAPAGTLPAVLQRQVSLTVTYLPSFGRLAARLDLGALPEQFAIDDVVIEVTRAADGSRVCEERLAPPKKGVATQHLSLPRLPAGDYRVRATVYRRGKPLGQPVEASFTSRKFPWEGNPLGLSQKVVPPFTPLVVSGDTVSMVLRRYRLGAMGLPAQITARDEPILAAPITLEALTGGRVARFASQGYRVVRAAPHEVVVEGTGTLGRLAATLRSTLDYDGFLTVGLSLQAAVPTDVERLSLNIPLKRSFAPLMHAVGDGIRANYSGFVPAGRGKVWDSTLVRRELI
ncbi:MAG: DUF6067 family protein, partial [Armatimonadota bacterium]|nr:DUF6067 family protein [Armatimonadota bacterium]